MFAPVLMQDELRADETIIHVAHRHWIVLFMRLFIPLIVLAASLGVLWYRVSQPQVFQLFSSVTFILIGVALVTLLLLIYQYADWREDQIIVTNQRVIYNIEKPLIRRVQEQLPINDIHQVEAETSSYPEHWLKFGSIQIQSASFGRPMIFRNVSHPQEIQTRIMRLLHDLKQEETDVEDFYDMVSRRVYSDEPPQPAPAPVVRRVHHPHALHWLFHENPYYEEESNTYIWHPHWFFLLKSLVKPSIFFLLVMGLVFASARFNLLTEPWIMGVVIGAGVIAGAWAAWEIEDHRNDRYILSPAQVIDIEKKPFGPERQSSANLDSIQNVTYTTTLFSRLMGYGNVCLELTGSGGQLTFFDVPYPNDVVMAIDSYQRSFNKNEKERNLEDTLHLLHTYHTIQQDAPSEEGASGLPQDRSNRAGGHGNEQDRERQPDEENALLRHLLLDQEPT
jgi:hypothetical protein